MGDVKLTVRTRLLMVMVPLVVAPLLACGVLLYVYLRNGSMEASRAFINQREQEVRDFAERTSDSGLASVLKDVGLHPEDPQIHRRFTRFQSYLQAYFAGLSLRGDMEVALRVFDLQGRELFRTPIPPPAGLLEGEELGVVLDQAVLRRPGQGAISTRESALMGSACPLYARRASTGTEAESGDGRTPVGVALLEYRYPEEEFRRQAQMVTLLSVGLTAGLTALAVFLVTHVVRSLINPVEILVQASRDVANGDLSVRAPVESEDEVGLLARTFNEMTERLSVTIQALEELNEQLEEKVEARTAELAQSEQLKNEFLSNVGHELRTPLNSILNLTKIMRSGRPGPLTEEQEKQLTIVERNAAKLHSLIESILDLAAVRAGSVRLAPTRVDMGRLLREIEAPCRTMAQNKDLEFYLEVDDNTPKVYCDPDRTKQAILQLVNNAAKFTEQGYIKVGCDADPLAMGDYVRCYVIDTGIGIPRDRQELIFKEFAQGDGSITRSYGGTGVGLTLVQKLIVAMGGEVTVSSEAGEGSTFSFTLPIFQPGKHQPRAAVQAS